MIKRRDIRKRNPKTRYYWPIKSGASPTGGWQCGSVVRTWSLAVGLSLIYMPDVWLTCDISMLLRVYITDVRQLLEYNTVIWSPSLKCGVTTVEKVQRRFTKRLPGFRNLSYAERRSKLNLTTLELNRLHNDLVMCYKIMFNIIRLEFSDFFTFNTYSSTRSHLYKLYVNHSRINVRKHFFAYRVVNVWHSLPLDSADFRSLHCFRSSISNILFQ